MNYTKGLWTVAADSYGKVQHSRKDCVFALDITGKTVGPTVAHAITNHADAQLIVSAVNACISINPDNPQAVAEAIGDVYRALKELSLTCRDVSYTHLALIEANKAIAKIEGR